jgi:hypothetical protein
VFKIYPTLTIKKYVPTMHKTTLLLTNRRERRFENPITKTRRILADHSRTLMHISNFSVIPKAAMAVTLEVLIRAVRNVVLIHGILC